MTEAMDGKPRHAGFEQALRGSGVATALLFLEYLFKMTVVLDTELMGAGQDSELGLEPLSDEKLAETSSSLRNIHAMLRSNQDLREHADLKWSVFESGRKAATSGLSVAATRDKIDLLNAFAERIEAVLASFGEDEASDDRPDVLRRAMAEQSRSAELGLS